MKLVKLIEINQSIPAINECYSKDMPSPTSFMFLELKKEVTAKNNSLIETIQGKELSKEEMDALCNMEVEIHSTIPKSQITFIISPKNLELISCFLDETR